MTVQAGAAKTVAASDPAAALESTVRRDEDDGSVSFRIENVIVARINGGGPVLRLKTLHGNIHILKTE